MTETKVSIIIPIYNGSDTLVKCLDSILGQTLQEYEVIMVNDGSTDSSEKICLSYAHKDERFRYFYQENAGASTAINYGCSFAKGEYIARVDCDDYVTSNFLSKPYSIAKKHNVHIVNFSHYYVTNGQEHKRTSIFPKNQIIEKEDFLKILSSGMPQKMTLLWFATMNFVKRQLLEDHNIKRDTELIFQDGVFNLLCYLNARGIYSINDHLYYYVNNPTSVTQVSFRENLFDNINSQFLRKRSIFKEYGLTGDHYKRYLSAYYLEHSFFYLISNKKNSKDGLTLDFLREIRDSEMYKYCVKYYKNLGFVELRKKIVIYFFRNKALRCLLLIYKVFGR